MSHLAVHSLNHTYSVCIDALMGHEAAHELLHERIIACITSHSRQSATSALVDRGLVCRLQNQSSRGARRSGKWTHPPFLQSAAQPILRELSLPLALLEELCRLACQALGALGAPLCAAGHGTGYGDRKCCSFHAARCRPASATTGWS